MAILALSSGIALSAATGIKAFAPLLVLSVLARRGLFALNSSHSWLSSDLAFYTLLVACIVEIMATAVPGVGSIVSWGGTLVKPLIGIYVASVVLAPEIAPTMLWVLATIVGAGAATPVAVTTALVHSAGDAGSVGLAAPLESAGETGSSVLLAVGAVLAPVLALIGLVLLFAVIRKMYGYVFTRGAQRKR